MSSSLAQGSKSGTSSIPATSHPAQQRPRLQPLSRKAISTKHVAVPAVWAQRAAALSDKEPCHSAGPCCLAKSLTPAKGQPCKLAFPRVTVPGLPCLVFFAHICLFPVPTFNSFKTQLCFAPNASVARSLGWTQLWSQKHGFSSQPRHTLWGIAVLAWPSVPLCLKWAGVGAPAPGSRNEGGVPSACLAHRCAAMTTRPSTLPATSLPPSAPWRAPRRATNSTWTTSGLANVSLSFGLCSLPAPDWH